MTNNGTYVQYNSSLFYTTEFEEFANATIDAWTILVKDWVTNGDVLVVAHETFVANKIRETRRILEFLQIEPDEERLKCVSYGEFDIYKRKYPKLQRSPYPAYLVNKIMLQIDIVNAILTSYGHGKLPSENYTQF